MAFIYIIPVYNEEADLPKLIAKLVPFLKARPGSHLVIADNGSRDATWSKVEEGMRQHPGWVTGLRVSQKGQGLAFREGMEFLSHKQLDPSSWIVFSAVDLPFEFDDADAIERHGIQADLVVGSKAHPESRINRGFVRGAMTLFYRLLRRGVLGMRTHDPQGSLFFRAKWLPLHKLCDARDFFFATQLVYFLERKGARVVEVPVSIRPDKRPSKVNPLKDGWALLKQVVGFGFRHGRLKGDAIQFFHTA